MRDIISTNETEMLKYFNKNTNEILENIGIHLSCSELDKISKERISAITNAMGGNFSLLNVKDEL